MALLLGQDLTDDARVRPIAAVLVLAQVELAGAVPEELAALTGIEAGRFDGFGLGDQLRALGRIGFFLVQDGDDVGDAARRGGEDRRRGLVLRLNRQRRDRAKQCD